MQWVVPHENLTEESRRIALEWIEKGVKRSYRGASNRDELKAVKKEIRELKKMVGSEKEKSKPAP